MSRDEEKKQTAEENPYLALRQAKIARNQARLRELGLLRKQSVQRSLPSSSAKLSSSVSIEKKISIPVRRSRRLSQQEDAVNYKEPTIAADTGRPIVKRQRVDTSSESLPAQNISDKAPKPRPPPSANSVRGISLSTRRLVSGDDNNAPNKHRHGLLGIPMEKTGKEFVVYEAFEQAASQEDQLRLENSRLSFNKYSGVQEWENCIFLWVNLGGKGNSVFNEFLEGGHQITWFGGSRMVDDSPIVQKLLAWGKEPTSWHTSTESKGSDSNYSKLVLWCRRFEVERKAFGPYICLGRLAYASHEPASYPLSFVWRLLDAEKLLTHEDTKVRSAFQAMIKSANDAVS